MSRKIERQLLIYYFNKNKISICKNTLTTEAYLWKDLFQQKHIYEKIYSYLVVKLNYGIKFTERPGVTQGFVTWHGCYYTHMFHVKSAIILIHTQKNLKGQIKSTVVTLYVFTQHPNC